MFAIENNVFDITLIDVSLFYNLWRTVPVSNRFALAFEKEGMFGPIENSFVSVYKL